LIEQLAAILAGRASGAPLRVGIDGVDASGKTTLADHLARVLQASGQVVLRASIDRFHNPCAVRYQRGADSPEGYYIDSFDLPALRRDLLDPLGPGGSRQVRLERYDFRSDRPVESAPLAVAPCAILLFDGVFLQRPELAGCWDVILFVKISFETVLARAVQRDGSLLGGPQAVIDRYQRRYLPAQRRYLQEHRPEQRADIVVYNDDPANAYFMVNGDRSVA
jgi:uridine kinase